MIVELQLAVVFASPEVSNVETLRLDIFVDPEALGRHIQVANSNVEFIAKEWG
ncbi:hypothetical protein D3C78_719340 [compost metagenome]